MSKKQIPFFATHGDLVTIAHDVRAVKSVDFVLAGLFLEPRSVILVDVDNLSAFETYLVLAQGAPVNFRAIPQRAGGQMYAVDQVGNPRTVVLQTGGLYADQHLIAGQLGTVGDCKESDDLYALFANVIRRRYEKIKSYFVGPEAAAMLDSGARLTATLKSPRMYDLAR